MESASYFPAGIEGFLLGLSLIVAIGAQNAFVLRQGLARQHVFAVATVCALSDFLLIAAGVGGLGSIIGQAPHLLAAITLAGAAFLVAYGLLSLNRARKPGAMNPAARTTATLGGTMATCLALTFLNPHVYLDTVVLIGALSARYSGLTRLAFAAGAGLASVLWFYGLGYGARLATPILARPQAWRILDTLIGITMLAIAARLASEALAG